MTCVNGANNVFAHAAVFGINTGATCPGNPYSKQGLSVGSAGNTVARGQRASWQANAPAGLVIVGAQVPNGQMLSEGINDGQQYGGGFYWAGGGAETHDEQTSAGFAPLWTSYFGFHVICGHAPTCDNLVELDQRCGHRSLRPRDLGALARSSRWSLAILGLDPWRLEPTCLWRLAVGAVRYWGDDQRSIGRERQLGTKPVGSGISAARRRSRKRSTHGSTETARCR